jgi:hypothetical protein
MAPIAIFNDQLQRCAAFAFHESIELFESRYEAAAMDKSDMVRLLFTNTRLPCAFGLS